jgi:hypothetical protein
MIYQWKIIWISILKKRNIEEQVMLLLKVELKAIVVVDEELIEGISITTDPTSTRKKYLWELLPYVVT